MGRTARRFMTFTRERSWQVSPRITFRKEAHAHSRFDTATTWPTFVDTTSTRQHAFTLYMALQALGVSRNSLS